MVQPSQLFLLQFAALHTRGSSGGSTRITRRVYPEVFYVHMMMEAFNMWETLEKECAQQLYKYVCGGQLAGRPDTRKGTYPMAGFIAWFTNNNYFP